LPLILFIPSILKILCHRYSIMNICEDFVTNTSAMHIYRFRHLISTVRSTAEIKIPAANNTKYTGTVSKVTLTGWSFKISSGLRSQ